VAAFYAWSPPRLTPVPAPPLLGPGAYLASLPQRAGSLWVEFWGRLGWLEYSAPPLAYWAIFAICLVLLAVMLRRHIAGAGPAADGYLPVAACAYLALLAAGEYANHAQAGLVLQGRYLLPLAVCLIPLVSQPVRGLPWLLPGALAALHVALAQATMVRYFEGGWATWLSGLR
jgi:hypothetical protein